MSRNKFIILYHVYLVILFTPKGTPNVSNEDGVCYDLIKNKKRCCVSHYEENGTCKVCPKGRFGQNCTEQCPQNSYGELCLGICNCASDETCDSVKGCVPKGVCTGVAGEFKCCINYYEAVKNICSACFPGSYGVSCKERCPNGTYGYLCRQKCNCSSDITCDERFGCVDQDCPPGKFGMECQDECPTGTFGKFCTGKCQCKSECDKRFGCPKKETSSFYEGKLFLISVSTSLVFITLLLIMVVRIRGIKWCRKCSDFSASNEKFEESSPVSYNLYKGKNSKGGKHTHQPDILTASVHSSINNLDKSPFNEYGSNEEMELGVYNTLTLRVTGYVEPATWTRHPITNHHSEASSTCSKTKYLSDSLSSDELTSNDSFRRVPSIYLQNSDNRNNTMQTFQQVELEYRENREDNSSTYSGNGNVYDEALPVHKDATGELRSKKMLMKELSCQLMNMKK